MSAPFTPQHEKLTVYHRMLDLIPIIAQISRRAPPSWSDVGDQLRRASSSVLLNTAEGAGEFSPGDKAHSYRIARRSATECMAAIDILTKLNGPDPQTGSAKIELNEVAAMLTGLVKSADARRK